MPRENVEFVEGLLAAGTAIEDKHALLAALPQIIAQACTPDIEWIEDPQRPDSRVYHGHAGVQESFEQWLEQWDEWGGEVDRCIDCGDDVLVIVQERGRGRSSGANVRTRNYLVFTIRAGKIARYQEFYDEHDALKSVGME